MTMMLDFLKGAYDPEYRKTSYAMKKMRASISKPVTKVIEVPSEYRIDPKNKGRILAPLGFDTEDIPVGVMFNPKNARWTASIRAGKQYHLGVFNTMEEAHAARLKAEERIRMGKKPR